MPRQKKGGHEMPIQKALISDDRTGEERTTDGCDYNLGNRTSHEMFGYLGLAHRRHVHQGSPPRVDASTTKLKVVPRQIIVKILLGTESFPCFGFSRPQGSGSEQ